MAKRGLSSVQRTLRACREQGRFVEKVEQWISFGHSETKGGTRRDAFGFIDILAIDTDAIVAIQVCTSSKAEHYRKIIECEYAHAWLNAGGRIELWSWSKRKIKRGGKAIRWTPNILIVSINDLEKKGNKSLHSPKDTR